MDSVVYVSFLKITSVFFSPLPFSLSLMPPKLSLLFTRRELLEQVAEFEKTDFKTTNKVKKKTCTTLSHVDSQTALSVQSLIVFLWDIYAHVAFCNESTASRSGACASHVALRFRSRASPSLMYGPQCLAKEKQIKSVMPYFPLSGLLTLLTRRTLVIVILRTKGGWRRQTVILFICGLKP